MASMDPKQTRPVIRSVDELMECFFDIHTSIEEAHGLLNLLGSARRDKHIPGIGLVDRSHRVKIIQFLCEAGNEVRTHPTLADDLADEDHPRAYAQLRRRARVVLVRHAIPSLDVFNYDDEPDLTESPEQTVARFFAENREQHCECRYNVQDLQKVRALYDPPHDTFNPTGFRESFYIALTNIGLTDLLVKRRDIGAIPVLSGRLGECFWAGKELPGVDKLVPTPQESSLPEGWMDRAEYSQQYADALAATGHWAIARAIGAMNAISARAGFILAHADQKRNPRISEVDARIAESLASLCAMALHLVNGARRACNND